MADEVVLDAGLTEDEVVRIAREDAPVVLGPLARERIADSHARIRALADSGAAVYGISTGFGALANTRIARERWAELQQSLVRSHAAGMGAPVERETVRAMLALRARTLALGYSGVRVEVVEQMLALLNGGYTPVVPEHGSLGASGDLAPLAHCALALIGEGELTDADGFLVTGADALRALGREPLTLGPKEGLALINGTDGMLGMLVLACTDLERLCATAEVAAAISTEALLCTDAPLAADVIALRPHAGQVRSARAMRALLEGSQIVASHREDDPRVQDAYSVRCAPQVIGAARDVLAQARATADVELASAVDNPSVLSDGRLVSNGNFHGVPVGFALDFLAIAAAEVGAIAERRVDRLLDVTRSAGLPPFLAQDAGVHSGLMIAQYSAAALVAENRRLASPASVDSLPTSGMQEDHVSMGWGAGRKLRVLLDNLARIVAVELVAGVRGLQLRAPLAPAPATARVVALLGTEPGPDRVLAPELAAAERLVRDGAIVRAAAG